MIVSGLTIAAGLLQESSRSGAGVGLLLAGGLIIIVCQIKILTLAFRKSVGWGLTSLFIPVVALIFVLTHWDEAGSTFLLQLVGSGLLIWAVMLGGSL
jgi:hypothetical protein